MINDKTKYIMSLNWTEEQKDILTDSFGLLDRGMYSCEKEGNEEKIRVLKKIHEDFHEVVLALALEDLIKELKEKGEIE